MPQYICLFFSWYLLIQIHHKNNRKEWILKYLFQPYLDLLEEIYLSTDVERMTDYVPFMWIKLMNYQHKNISRFIEPPPQCSCPPSVIFRPIPTQTATFSWIMNSTTVTIFGCWYSKCYLGVCSFCSCFDICICLDTLQSYFLLFPKAFCGYCTYTSNTPTWCD